MNKIISTLFLGIYLAVFPLNNVSAAPEPQKIAIVDTQKILTSSTQLKNLKSNSETKNKELIELIKKAQAEINKQTDAKQKKVIAEKYEKQIVAKRNANAKEYTTKLKAIDDNITLQISTKAKELGYTMVLPKSAVIYGGDDITEAVLKVIK